MSNPGVSIVIPIYNEAESLEPLLEEVAAALASLPADSEIILIDDGSTDGSFARLAELQARWPKAISVIRLRRNYGQAAAMAAGFDAASSRVVVCMDADLQNDPADIQALLDKLAEGYDVVSGWRVHRRDGWLTRRLPSAIANALISVITRVPLHDYGCTLKAYSRPIIRDIRLYGEMHRYLPALAAWAGARVAEVPVNHRPRRFGRSKYGLGRTLRVLLDLITVRFLLSYSTKPMHIFGKWGLLTLALGTLAGVIALAQKLVPPYLSLNRNGWFFIGCFFVMAGLQFLSIGLLGEMHVRTYYESQGKPIYAVRERIEARRV